MLIIISRLRWSENREGERRKNGFKDKWRNAILFKISNVINNTVIKHLYYDMINKNTIWGDFTMTDKELLRKKTIQNRILIFAIIVLLILGVISYKRYFDEKREREIGESIRNAMSETKTTLDKVEEKLSVMDRMSFSDSGGTILFISVYYWPDDELKLGELADAIEEIKDESWFKYDYAVIEIWNPQLGMVTSIETNLETMDVRSYGWYDEQINK